MDNQIFQKNFLALANQYPEFASKLMTYQNSSSLEIQLDEGKEATLLVNGRQLTSHHDREGLACYHVKKIDLHKLVTIYGFGLGDEIRYILSKNKQAKINVVILNPALFVELLSIDSELYELFCSQVEFTLPTDDYPYFANSIILVSELYLCPEVFNSLKIKLINTLDYDFSKQYFENTVQQKINANLKDNYERLKSQKPFTKDNLALISQNVIITGSGPSLEDNIDRLKAEFSKPNTTLMAVDTSLNTLYKHNIVPNIIVSIDENVYRNHAKRLFNDLKRYEHTTLIFNAQTDGKLIDTYLGDKYFIYSKKALEILRYLPAQYADFITCKGSVLNTSVNIAIKAKARVIKLFGADFAYKGDKIHSGDIPKGLASVLVDSTLKVLCNDNRIQESNRAFCLYREYLEKDIKDNPSIRFENYSKTGAVVVGAINC